MAYNLGFDQNSFKTLEELGDSEFMPSVYDMDVTIGENDEVGYEATFNFEIMQYTGLKDKNGREIYEGDILKKDRCWSIRIEYEDGTHWVKDLDKIRYNNEITCIPISLFGINTWEIIGNIYENPKLLEEVTNE